MARYYITCAIFAFVLVVRTDGFRQSQRRHAPQDSNSKIASQDRAGVQDQDAGVADSVPVAGTSYSSKLPVKGVAALEATDLAKVPDASESNGVSVPSASLAQTSYGRAPSSPNNSSYVDVSAGQMDDSDEERQQKVTTSASSGLTQEEDVLGYPLSQSELDGLGGIYTNKEAARPVLYASANDVYQTAKVYKGMQEYLVNGMDAQAAQLEELKKAVQTEQHVNNNNLQTKVSEASGT